MLPSPFSVPESIDRGPVAPAIEGYKPDGCIRSSTGYTLSMRDLLKKSVAAAIKKMKAHAELVELENVDESTFRSFLLAEIKRRRPEARCQTEWHLFDLLVQIDTASALVELKFYITRHTRDLDDRAGFFKGGASKKNEDEFKKCVRKLRRYRKPRVAHKYLILIYEKTSPKRSNYSFARSYDNLAAGPRIRSVIGVPHCMADTLACKIIEVA